MFRLIKLHDEIPGFGSGRRLVYIDKIGRKWVHLALPSTAATARIDYRTWSQLTRSAEEFVVDQASRMFIRKALKRNVGRDAPKTRKALRKRIENALT